MDGGQTLAFATQLRRARHAVGLTQEEAAERSGVSVRTISDLERGVTHTPHADTVMLLAKALGLQGTECAAFVTAASLLRAAASPGRVPASGGGEGSKAPFVGRQHELALLERHLAGQGPPVLLLAGEPGIGKTRLLHMAAPRAVGHGLTVLQGGCQRRGGQEPYAPLLGALKGHLRRQTPGQQRAALRGCAWLVRMLPELAGGPIEPLPAWTLPPEQERRLMFEAAARFLTNVAGQGMGGVLLLLDDVQWAGSDALDLLSTLVRSAADIPLRVIGTYRDNETGPRDLLSVTLADLAHAGLAACHVLRPLALHEAGELLAALRDAGPQEGTEDAAQRERLIQRTGGVPFFLISYAQTTHAAGGLELLRSDGEQPIPWTVAQTIQQRIAALPEPVRDVLRVAAVVGRVVEPALLAAVTAHAERDVFTALEVALHARLLQEEQRAYRFAHDIIREVIEADLGVLLRVALYRRVAVALEQDARRESALERLAYYYTQGDVLDKAALYLEEAGDRARRGYANTAAEGCFREAATHLGTLGRRAEAARVQEKAGAMLRMLGRHDEAMAMLERAADIHGAVGDLDSMARALAETWLLHAEAGTAEEGARRFQTVLDLLEAQGGASTGLAMLYSAQVNLFSTNGDYHGLAHAARRAMELAGATGDPEVLAEAKFKHGLPLSSVVGGVEEGLQAYREATRLGEAAGGMTNLAGWYNVVTGFHAGRGDLEQSRRANLRSRAVAEQQDNLLRREIARVMNGVLALHTGDWGQAGADFSQAAATFRQMGAIRQILGAVIDQGHLCMVRGDWAEAVQHLEEAEELAQRTRSFGGRRDVACLLAERALREGRATRACARLSPLLDRPGLQEVAVTPLLVCLAWATLELGKPQEAASLAAQAVGRLRADRLRLPLADALRVQALVAARQSRWLEAEQALEEGLHLAQAIPYPYAEARLLQVSGELRLRQGHPASARDRASRALALCQRLGARKDSEHAEQLLFTLG